MGGWPMGPALSQLHGWGRDAWLSAGDPAAVAAAAPWPWKQLRESRGMQGRREQTDQGWTCLTKEVPRASSSLPSSRHDCCSSGCLQVSAFPQRLPANSLGAILERDPRGSGHSGPSQCSTCPPCLPC